MKLYRGYVTAPEFLTPKIAERYEELKRLKKEIWARHPSNPLKALEEMGEEHFNRLYELRKIAGPQFFTDEEKAARDVAGKKGFVITVDLEDELARSYHQGEQYMAAGSRIVSNFVIRGRELAQHLEDWKVEVIDIQKESTEGRISGEGESTKI